MKEEAYWYWLCNRRVLGAVKMGRLLKAFGSPEGIWRAGEAELAGRGGLRPGEAAEVFRGRGELDACAEEAERLSGRGIRMIPITDAAYPDRLRRIPDPPACLFVKGKLPPPEAPSAAVVGARGCTAYGQLQAEQIAGELAAAGCWIISGLAYGIDAAAHRGAVRAGGRTCAVLGCGVDLCYPEENYPLYEEILQRGGGILSEFPPKTPPLKQNFPIRNRVISGLADAVLVMEARKRSGSLITVEKALEQGKEIFALPGRADDPLSRGCLELIRDGAHILTEASDVLTALSLSPTQSLNYCEEVKFPLAEEEKLVYSAIANSPKHRDEILRELKIPESRVHAALLNLELSGAVRQTAKNYFVRTGFRN